MPMDVAPTIFVTEELPGFDSHSAFDLRSVVNFFTAGHVCPLPSSLCFIAAGTDTTVCHLTPPGPRLSSRMLHFIPRHFQALQQSSDAGELLLYKQPQSRLPGAGKATSTQKCSVRLLRVFLRLLLEQHSPGTGVGIRPHMALPSLKLQTALNLNYSLVIPWSWQQLREDPVQVLRSKQEKKNPLNLKTSES